MNTPSNQLRIPAEDIELLKAYMRLAQKAATLKPKAYRQEVRKLGMTSEQFKNFVTYALKGPYDDHMDELKAELRAETGQP